MSRQPRILTNLPGLPGGRWHTATVYAGIAGSPWPRLRRVIDFLEAVRMMWTARSGDVILADGAGSGLWLGLLRSLLGSRGARLLLFDCYWYRPGPLRRAIVRLACKRVHAIIVWSRQQIENYSSAYGIPQSKFTFLPYKANFSRHNDRAVSWGGYIFSGGNSERDYATLFRAVRGTGIPTIVSRTDLSVTDGLQCPDNVTVVSAVEPHFRRLMAGADLVVVPIRRGLLRGAGEQTLLNAMWYGKPVIAADDVSARDYIADGTTGFIVPAGDAAALRGAIMRLWNDPALRRRMGEEAKRHAAEHYTHDLWLQRMIEVAAAHLG